MATVAQVTGPTGAQRTWQEKRANDAFKEYENHSSELRDMQFL